MKIHFALLSVEKVLDENDHVSPSAFLYKAQQYAVKLDKDFSQEFVPPVTCSGSKAFCDLAATHCLVCFHDLLVNQDLETRRLAANKCYAKYVAIVTKWVDIANRMWRQYVLQLAAPHLENDKCVISAEVELAVPHDRVLVQQNGEMPSNGISFADAAHQMNKEAARALNGSVWGDTPGLIVYDGK